MQSLNVPLWGDLVVRFIHVAAGIMWVGGIYWFNFVFLHWIKEVPKEMAGAVVPGMLGRVVRWARWAAMASLVFGLTLYVRTYMWSNGHFGPNGYLVSPDGGLTDRSWWIHLGMLCGITMWGLMWFLAGPAYDKMMPIMAQGKPPPEHLHHRSKIGGVISTILTGPVIILMLGASHYSSFNALLFVAIIVAIGITMGLIAASATVAKYKGAPAAGAPAAEPAPQRRNVG